MNGCRNWGLWCVIVLVGIATASADDPPDVELLKQFRSEFVRVAPGQGMFPVKQIVSAADEQGDVQTIEVTFDQPFEICKYETTQEIWQLIMKQNPSRWQGVRNSVEMVSCVESREFCQRMTRLLREYQLLPQNLEVRLPTESEWEYCVRAGAKTTYCFGDDQAALGDHAWFTANAAGNDPPVGAKRANKWGLFDMHGYVWEWCESADGTAVLRGGSWKDSADRLACSFRRIEKETLRDDAVGFRCVIGAVRN